MVNPRLRSYQRFGVSFLRRSKRCVLADEMGVGKTPQLIRAARGATLVVAPPALHTNWRRELELWGSRSDISRYELTSYHSLVDLRRKDGHGHVAGVIKPAWRQPWDTLIFDEAHHLKGRNTGYAKAGVKLAADVPNVYMATGTPIRNWAHELFMLLRVIHPGDERFDSYWRWADRWFTVTEQERWQGRKKRTSRHVGSLRDVTTWEHFVEANGIEGHWLRREIDDIGLDLPPLQEILVPVEMGAKQRSVYRSMEKHFFAEYDGTEIVAETTGSQWANLMRLSSGLRFHPDFERGPSAKLDALGDLTEGNRGPFLVFASYRSTVDGLAGWFQERGLSAAGVHGGISGRHRDITISQFQDGYLDVLVGTYDTLGEGHNLTVCNKTILFENSPVPSMIDQAMARTRRYGQTKPCTVWNLVTADTVDEYYVQHLLPAKRGQSRAVITAAEIAQYRKGKK